ncbi:ABC transporter substrate-binding protein [Lentzea tibetensis]|uniref:ABC transporter substrate-binding protein n=1 Tax=Lentzea tibetensis TaxID=2591470 RepID=A0A563ESQ8_9PSEU|nr:ABC transporter substrate-binding protein [Lentzea tibetensis]TWP50709.1 ABC transporter substrate-binding protein [Lentzea tibetensis]
MSDGRIGVVAARTGRLAVLGGPLEFAAREHDVLLRDSGSTAAGARRAAEELILRDGVPLVVTLGGTDTLPAVVEVCERLRTPCVSTVLPWQVWLGSRSPEWTFHFCWGVDDIATVFADMWELVAPSCRVGCLWNDGPQGAASRRWFAPVAVARGHQLVDRPYRELSGRLPSFGDVDVVTGAPTAADLAALPGAPRLITCSRWLTYPFGVSRFGLDGVATIVSWTPTHRHVSSVDGQSCAELAGAYESATGRPWLQPLGLAHALFEVATRALAVGEDKEGIASALRTMRIATIAGVLDWTTGPAPGVATVELAGGQWRAGAELAVVSTRRTASVARSGELVVR